MEINKVIRHNAVSAYLMFLICGLFLFQKNDEKLNNDFVRSHTKSAFLIHILIIINLVIFRFYGLLGDILIYKFSLNAIISNIIFGILFGILFFGIYRANKGEKFSIGEVFKVKKEKNLVDVERKGNYLEKDKVTFVLSYIPFIGQIFTLKYDKNENIKEILKLNTFVSLIFCLLFIHFYYNLNEILILFYIVFIAFVGVNLFGRGELITINLPSFLSFEVIYRKTKIFFKYMKNYITGNFKEFSVIEEEQEIINKKDKIETFEKMQSLPELNGPKKIIYFPIINLYFIFFKKNKYQIHIRNSLVMSFIFIITIVLVYFGFISRNWFVLFLFPISFGIGNLGKIYYKMPIIYDIYYFFIKFINFFKSSKKKISDKSKEVKELNLKVGEKNIQKTQVGQNKTNHYTEK